VIGSASRLGGSRDNQILIQNRAENVRDAINDLPGDVSTQPSRARFIDARGIEEPPEDAASFGEPEDDPLHRLVVVFVNGYVQLRLR
jgi:hypothetical protein